ncbi:PD40 domain-containing protein [candidate division WOR-3 bacterium]|nr:PD40 domain-containing protein [candidate division WOR-3 bacterium]
MFWSSSMGCFSSDGSMIYFISNRDVPQGGWTQGDWEIYVVDTTGAGTATKAIVDAQGQSLLMDYTEHDPCCSTTDDDIIVFATNKAKPTYTEQVDRINFELWEYSISNHTLTRLTESWNDAVNKELWNSSMPCFSPDGERIAWSCDNWTGISWQNKNPDGSYPTSYWKPDGDQGSSHQIWTRRLDQSDHHYWFPPSYWGWNPDWTPPQPWPWGGYSTGPGHQHHKHYNPSWDWLEPQE